MKYWKRQIPHVVSLCIRWAKEYNLNYYIMFPPNNTEDSLGCVAADYMCGDEPPDDVMLTVCPDGSVLYGYHT